MSSDARAKIKLSDGREVWRYNQARYREVGTGRWISAEEAEALFPPGIVPVSDLADEKTDIQKLKARLLEVQSQIALDKESGAKATSAARLVLNTLREMETREEGEEKDRPWFHLGRALAEEVLALVVEEQDSRTHNEED